MQKIQSVTIWGDSVMKGVVYDENRARYTLLEECCANEASKTLGLTMQNRARMGCTVTKGLSLLKKDLGSVAPADVALLEFGGNDCDYDWAQVAANPQADHQPKTPLALFTAQLTEMVKTVKQRGMMPVLMTLPPIHAERYFRFFTKGGLNGDSILYWLGDVQHIYRWHERYSAAVTRVAQECDCPLADVRDAFLAQRRYSDLLCADGIHPNAKGHRVIQEVLEKFGLPYVAVCPTAAG